MLSEQDVALLQERKARKKILSLIASVRNAITNGEISHEPAQVIALSKSLAQQLGVENNLIAWAEIRLSNNNKYPAHTGIVETLDSLASVDNLLVDAGKQLKREKT